MKDSLLDIKYLHAFKASIDAIGQAKLSAERNFLPSISNITQDKCRIDFQMTNESGYNADLAFALGCAIGEKNEIKVNMFDIDRHGSGWTDFVITADNPARLKRFIVGLTKSLEKYGVSAEVAKEIKSEYNFSEGVKHGGV